jgi:hypothetical protein
MLILPNTNRPAYGVLLCAVFGVGVFGCRAERPIEDIEAAHGLPTREGSGASESDPLEAGLLRAERIFVRDAEMFGQAITVALTDGAFENTSWPLEAGNCYTFVSWGEPDTSDFDLRLDTPDGQTAAWDDSPDNFPLISRFCATRTARHNLRITSARGAGEVRVRAWRQQPGEARDAERELSALAQQYLPAEFSAEGAVQYTALRESRELEVPFAMLPGRCYAVVAWSPEITDLDLVLHDGGEEPLMRDLGTDARPVLLPYCATTASAPRIRLVAYAGTGAAWWQVYSR